jgi:hypothetical protein
MLLAEIRWQSRRRESASTPAGKKSKPTFGGVRRNAIIAQTLVTASLGQGVAELSSEMLF